MHSELCAWFKNHATAPKDVKTIISEICVIMLAPDGWVFDRLK